MIMGKGAFISPSDSLALHTANAHLAPVYSGHLAGVARSRPTSRAVDLVAIITPVMITTVFPARTPMLG